MAVGFTQEEERTFIVKVKASVFDYIWSDERIEKAKSHLDGAFSCFEEATADIANDIFAIDSIEVSEVARVPSRTI